MSNDTSRLPLSASDISRRSLLIGPTNEAEKRRLTTVASTMNTEAAMTVKLRREAICSGVSPRGNMPTVFHWVTSECAQSSW